MTVLIGRDQEFAVIEEFVADAGSGPSALVLTGEPGIGKTVLWEAGIAKATQRGARVLDCRGIEAEATLSFTGLSELLGPVLDEAMRSLLAPRRRALEIALLITEPGDDPPDAHAVGLAVLDILRVVAEAGPVLLALDDAQWLDPASSGALALALRRLRSEQIGVLATLRVAPDVAAAFPLERSFASDRLARLVIGPLSMAALHGLLKQRVGLELTRPALRRVWEATAGHPYFALEVGRELMRTGTRPAPGQPMHVPASLRDLLGGRLARLPTETGDIVLLIAALARPTVELVAAAHGDRDRVLRALEDAIRDGVVELDDSQVRFAHSLLASICYDQAPIWKRRAVHRALAGVVGDVEERARHLALAAEGPDAVVASELDAAADGAAARGATAAAAELCELAAALTGDDPALARQRRFRAAGLHPLAGDGVRARTVLEQLLGEASAGAERADVLYEIATGFHAEPSVLVELYEQALAEAQGDEVRTARILGFRSMARFLHADSEGALLDARLALENAERTGDPSLMVLAIARLGQAEMWAGEVTPGLLERGAELEERYGLACGFLTSARFGLSRLLTRKGKLDRARVLLERLDGDAVARGDELARVYVRWYTSMLDWLAGDLPRALELAREAYELGEQTELPDGRAWRGRQTALVECDLGLVERARASAEDGLAYSRAKSGAAFAMWCAGVLGRLELAVGNLQSAGAYLVELPERLRAAGLNDPTNPAWADAIETLVSLGELGRARGYLERYEFQARRLTSPWAVASAARCRGMLCAAEGDLPGAFASFDRALTELEQTPFPLEHGRTLLCVGMTRRQGSQKRAAREALEQAATLLANLGARLWAEKAQAELARVSGRRGAGDELTENERQVAAMAAEGLSNKQIAATLFMGVSTVEAHLSHAYRKLGIRSRAGLGARLASVDPVANPVDGAAQS
ncbi:MAG TPA: AAA family ATPase [Solirubrobacteraceae bacterium]|nr:AAA family ATPase [Solirubrobacteraceae bacterium]